MNKFIDYCKSQSIPHPHELYAAINDDPAKFMKVCQTTWPRFIPMSPEQRAHQALASIRVHQATWPRFIPMSPERRAHEALASARGEVL
jgi:hypothetical protein